MHKKVIAYDMTKVEPIFPLRGGEGIAALTFLPNITIAKGTVLGQVTATTADCVQTLNFGGTATGGTFTLSIAGVDGNGIFSTSALAYNITNANLKTAIETLLTAAGYEGGVVTITNGPAPADTTITFGGTLAGMNVPTMTVVTALTGDAGAVAASLSTDMVGTNNDLVFTAKQTGAAGNRINIHLIDPNGNSQALAVTVVQESINISLATAGDGALTSTAAQVKSAVEASAAASALVTVALKAANDGTGVVTIIEETALTGGSDGNPIGLAIVASQAGTQQKRWGAYSDSATDGRDVARAIAMHSFRTNGLGQVILSGSNSPAEYGIYRLDAPAYFKGRFKTTDLVGLDTNGAADLGRIESGTVDDGIIALG